LRIEFRIVPDAASVPMITASPPSPTRRRPRPATGRRRPAIAEVANDTHSALNPTRIARRFEPRSADEVADVVRMARRAGEPLAIAGGRHAMGGQQFLQDGWLLDLRHLRGFRSLDVRQGRLEAEAGICWPELMRHYLVPQAGATVQWGLRQKQTGADRLTLGGAIAANIHGRVLQGGPFVQDIESLEVVDAAGELRRCSRTADAELFRHVVGGYGLFGVVTAAELRLVPRVQVERVVTLGTIDELADAMQARIRAGYLYGDFQFATWPGNEDFLRTGVLSCYRPVRDPRPIPHGQRRLSQRNWNQLLELAHTDKQRAFEVFTAFYLATSGQRYYSDTHQLNLYLEDYHGPLDHRLGACVRGSEMITELYVPRDRLAAFMGGVRSDFRDHATNVIYGTIRLIDADMESALPWARASWACVIFNLHVDHRPEDIGLAGEAFRRLIDRALDQGGSYYLTYHAFARAEQLLRAHPGVRDFLEAKARLDPQERFQSDWYRHLRTLLS
jgi:FAD/FMN-containing dehydrogenase